MAEKNIPTRMFPKLKVDLLGVGAERVKKNLMLPRDVNMPKMTELLTRTKGYQLSLEELKLKPEKKK